MLPYYYTLSPEKVKFFPVRFFLTENFLQECLFLSFNIYFALLLSVKKGI